MDCHAYILSLLCTASLTLGGCGDDGSTGASAGMSTDPAPATTTSGGPGSTGVSGSSSTGAPTTGGVSESGTASEGTTEGTSGGSSGGVKFDVGPAIDGGGGCAIQCGNSEWSYVWIANSGEHTISKINTREMIEEGRYITRADKNGNPSRTSVSIDGKAVVVANRHGGVTKIWARPEFCTDKNGNGKIDTSTGKNDVLPFDQEECIAWYTPFDGTTSQRPVAWSSGTYNPRNCQYEDQKVWTAAVFGTEGPGSGCGGSDGIHVYRLDGDDGTVEDEVHVPDVPCGAFGAYGAAVDSANNAWFTVLGGGSIFRVDHETLAHETISGGFYGITVDTKGRVWLDDGSRYDPMTKSWATQVGDLPTNGGSGVAQDLKGRVWHASGDGLGWIDPETMAVGGLVPLPVPDLARGIAVDIDGYIWAVPILGTVAHRIHPDTFDIATYDGLYQAYTYSDMAGGQLNNVTCNPQG